MTRSASEALAAQSRPIRRRRSWPTLVAEGFRDLFSRRRLVRFMVGADLKRTHSDTIVGRLWWILDPLLQMAVYWLLVVLILNRDIPDYPLFLFAAILPWKWFSTTLNDAALSVTGRQSLIRQVQFPKIVLPTASVVAGTVSFGFGLIALGLVYLFYLQRLSAWVLVLPLVAFVQFVFTMAVGILFAAVNTFFRDIQNVLRHALRLWFYLSPALYSLDAIEKDHPSIHAVLSLNPFSILFGSYRNVTYGTTAPDWIGLAALLGVSCLVLVAAVYLFKRVEPMFARIL
jgi:lipopolysaccharide transport system permease protein/teichoic acid transport system permease protein